MDFEDIPANNREYLLNYINTYIRENNISLDLIQTNTSIEYHYNSSDLILEVSKGNSVYVHDNFNLITTVITNVDGNMFKVIKHIRTYFFEKI